MHSVLRPVELVYRSINRVRRACYRAGILSPKALPRPVVSVGNIAIGGGGKTPTVIALAEALVSKGLRVAILTRGYGGELSEKAGRIVEPPLDAVKFGDEPVLMARRLEGADVVVGARRWESGLAYLVQRDCDVFLLDDGFQHLQLRRDLDIVLDRANAPWHREGRSALRDADIVLRRVDDPGEDRDGTARLAVSTFLRDDARHPAEELRGKKVFVFSGLADNEQFRRTVAGLGCEIVGTREFGDHHRYTKDDVAQILDEAARSDAVPVTSEKDAVKIDSPAVVALEASMWIPSLDAIVTRILGLARK
jgi:tetraacyldisaccharide 4'-kinase